jgi:ATP-dependent RNA helicase RhlE
MTEPTFRGLGLAASLLRALEAEDHASPTPIQARAIPPLLAGKDLLGIAKTGTGKTAAFLLPLLQALSSRQDGRTAKVARALILTPTRELAAQIGDRVAVYGRHVDIRHAVVFGGVGQGPQVARMARGVDILIATPGRLLDLVAQRHIRLDLVSHLVVDEADRMLDLGFVHDMRKIMALLPKRRQSMLFSATMPPEVARLAADLLNDPRRVEVELTGTTVEAVAQQVIFVEAAAKKDLLVKLLGSPDLEKVLVFTRTKHGADRVSRYLDGAGITARAIHGNKSQTARQRALDDFRSGRAPVLVATDVAARGIDVPMISHVINFDLPNVPEDYVHRIGRTGRAGQGGAAISFCDQSERAYLRDIERLIRRAIKTRDHGPALPGVSRLGASAPRLVHASSRLAAEPHRHAPRSGSGRGRKRRQRAA